MAKSKKERRIAKAQKRNNPDEIYIRDKGHKRDRKNEMLSASIINAQAQKEAEEAIADSQVQEETVDKNSVERIWEEICEMVKTLSEDSKETYPEIWSFVKDKEIQERTEKGLNETDRRIIKMIEDEHYFSEVKYVTEFRYLMEDSLFARAWLGHSKRKFNSLDNYNRYCELRRKLQEIGSEEFAIKKLLEDPDTDDVTRRILTMRKQHIEKEKESKEKQYGIDCK